jgi:hypothetical protein
MARLLMIHFRFPPAHVVSSKRLGHIYLSAKSAFDRVHVITSEVSLNYPSDPLLYIPIPYLDVIKHRDFRSTVSSYGQSSSQFIGKAKKSWLGQYLLSMRKRWPFFYFFGDGGKDYIQKTAARARELIRDEGFTHIFTSYGPYADIIIGQKLKQEFPGLYWIADFRDIFDNQPALEPPLIHPFWYLRQKIKRADHVTTVSEGLAERLRQMCKDASVLYNGIGDFSQHPDETQLPPPIRITYTGSLYGDRWEALRLFYRAIHSIGSKADGSPDLKNLQFRYYGSECESSRWLAESEAPELDAVHQPTVSIAEALQHQKESHINLLLSWSHRKQRGVLSAKLFEYIGAKRPIFAIIQGPHDAELQYWIEKVGRGRCYFSTIHMREEISQGLALMISQVREGRWQPQKVLPEEIFWSAQGPKFWKRLLG